MFTKKFVKDTAERLIATFAEVLLASLTVDANSHDLQTSFQTKLTVAGVATGYALLKALAATRHGSRTSASLVA